MSAVATRHEAHVIPADAGSIMAVIARVASDPNADVEKLERLLAMHERISAQGAKVEYFDAMAQLQIELPAIVERGGIKDRAGNVQSTYARWEDINEVIKPILSRFGFALSFRVGQDEGQISVTGVLSHRGGHSEETTMRLPVDGSGSKNAVQAVGSSTSYGKRYTAQALLNLVSYGEDDDGQKGGAARGLTDDQASEIQALMEDVGADRAGFLAYMKADSIAAIPAADFKRAMSALEKKRAR